MAHKLTPLLARHRQQFCRSIHTQFSFSMLSSNMSQIFRTTIMNTQAATTKAIDWKHVAGVTLRGAFWLLKIAFKGVVLLGSVLIMIVAAIFSGPDDEEEGRDKKHWSDNDSDFDGSFPSYDLRGRSDATKNNL
jgi:hypothetical protein